jgi:hypothetical protein
VILAARTLGNGVRLAECARQIVADKAAHVMQLDMIVFAKREQVARELRGIPALGSFQDHGPSPGTLPSARRSSARRADISRQACFRSASVSGVTGREPVFTAFGQLVQIRGQPGLAQRAEDTPQGFVILDRVVAPRLARRCIIPQQPLADIRAERFAPRGGKQLCPLLMNQAQGERRERFLRLLLRMALKFMA